jgi:hypothetical protein
VNRVLALLAATILLLGSCDRAGGASVSTTMPTVPPSSSTTAPIQLPDAAAITRSDGSLVIIGSDGGERLVVPHPTDGAFRQPMWLDDTTLVVGSSTTTNYELVALDTNDGTRLWSAPMESPPFFTLPAPPASPFATTSLRNDPGGDGLIAELVDDEGTVTELSREAPFYASWSPDGRSLAIHAGGAHLDVTMEGITRTIAQPTGVFQTPAWTARGVVTLRTADRQVLSVWADGDFTDVGSIDGPVRFVASSRRIALQSSAGAAGGVQATSDTSPVHSLPSGRLIVVDLDTAEVATITASLVPIFQWSPSGTGLLYATFDDASTEGLSWHIWNVDGTTTDIGVYDVPQIWFRDVAPFFDQYAQALSLWSADGTQVGLPGTSSGRPAVVIVDTDDGAQTIVDDATWVTFAPAP